LRKEVDGFISALPVPYKTTNKQPTFESLKKKQQRKYPINLEPFLCNRFEMAAFAKEAKEIGVNYIGICCGGMPYQVRSMAEALDKKPLGSKYSPAMELHPMIGTRANAKDKKKFIKDWND
jgi:betaine-homocysteine S-methyltransferase